MTAVAAKAQQDPQWPCVLGQVVFFGNRGVNDYLVAGNWIVQNVCNLSETLREKEKTKHVKEIKEHHLYLDYQ